MKRMKLDSEWIRELLSYDPSTGLFRWRRNRRRVKPGDVAGSRNVTGYIYIRIEGRDYKAHRLAWLFMTGCWPTSDVDHRNGDGCDNRWDNLRAATKSQNIANSRLRRDNKAGYKGVAASGAKWMANINKDRRRYYLGTFDTAEAAHDAYVAKANELHGPFARPQ